MSEQRRELATGASCPLLIFGITAVLLASGPGCGSDAATPAAPVPSPPETPPPSPPPETPTEVAIPDEVGAWLDANVQPFDGSRFSLPHTDLEFLRDLVGDARIVALGENTRGARDFFEMKARILRFLVEEMGFNTFAIEAAWPEARRLDHYVRTGEGDPEVFLSGLYYWPWRAEAILEMVEWMRAHNEAGGDLGFHGVDMQYPGLALHLVREFVRVVDPGQLDAVTAELDCLARYSNEPDGDFPAVGYPDLTNLEWAACGAALERVRELLDANQTRYEIAGGADAFAITERSLRVAYQYHLDTIERNLGAVLRGEFMAENTIWLSDRIGPEGRMVLWTHNYHLSIQPETPGRYLREAFGDDMVVIGFSHAEGRFTARGPTGEISPEGLPINNEIEFDLHPPLEDSFEAYFAAASAPRFALELRQTFDDPGSEWLSQPRPFRRLVGGFNPNWPAEWTYFLQAPLPDWFDAVIHFASTRPTILLPRRMPSTW